MGGVDIGWLVSVLVSAGLYYVISAKGAQSGRRGTDRTSAQSDNIPPAIKAPS